MSSIRISLEAYETFVTVARLCSFSKAERVLGRTQGTISKRISMLEREMGSLLFERRGPRPVTLTDAGEMLLDMVGPLLDSFDELPENLGHRLAGKPTLLRIGCGQTDASRLLPPVVAAFSKRYPMLQVQVRVMRSANLIEAVEQGRVQIGLSTREPGHGSELLYIRLAESEMMALVHKSHPLAQRDRIDLRSLGGHGLVLPDGDSHARGVIEKAFRKMRMMPRVAIETGGWEAIQTYAAMGCGAAIVPAAHVSPARRDLRVIPINADLPKWVCGLIVQEATLGDPLARDFVLLLCEHLKVKAPAIVSKWRRV